METSKPGIGGFAMEGPIEEIVFTARYKDWMVVKKLLVESMTKPEDVALTLSSIDNTMVRKSYEFTGLNVDMIDAYVAELCKGKSKSWGSLVEAFSGAKPAQIKERLKGACPAAVPTADGKVGNFMPIAEAYFVKRVIETVGYPAVLTPEILQEAYPSLKIPKPRGNFGKKKKK